MDYGALGLEHQWSRSPIVHRRAILRSRRMSDATAVPSRERVPVAAIRFGLERRPEPGHPSVGRQARAAAMHLQLRIADRSRQALTCGTEIPVVRRSEIAESTPVYLLGVPTREPFRAALRVYDLENPGTSRVLVRLFRLPEQQGDTGDADPFLEFPMNLEYLPETSRSACPPRFAQVTSISDSFPAVLNFDTSPSR